MSAPDAFANASGSEPSPVVSVTKIGAAGLGAEGWVGAGGRSEAAASVSVACLGTAAASGASVAWKERSSERPA
jgi:hypothetical protein